MKMPLRRMDAERGEEVEHRDGEQREEEMKRHGNSLRGRVRKWLRYTLERTTVVQKLLKFRAGRILSGEAGRGAGGLAGIYT